MTKTSAFEQKFIKSSDGLSLFYRDYNSSSERGPIVCLPGLTRNSRDFEELAPRLSADGWRVVALDLRGRGWSDYDPNPANYIPATYVADTFDILDSLKAGPVVVVGTSLGGLMAMMMAAADARRLRAVILNDVGPEIDPRGLERIRGYVGKGTPRQTWREVLLAYSVVNAHIYPGLSEQEWEVLARQTHTQLPNGDIVPDYDPMIANAFAAANGAQPVPDLWPIFDALSGIPTLAFRGETSDILSPETFAQMQRRNPSLIAITVANRGHVPLLNEPECKRPLNSFLAGLPA